MHEDRRFATRAVHAGQAPDPTTGAIMMPVYQTSTYVQPKLGEPLRGYEYARVQNPTREAMQANVAALESARHGIAFASGMAAIEAIVKRLSQGDHVIYEENCYGGTQRMFTQVFARLGLEFTAVDARDPACVADRVRPTTRLILVETPTNPMMRICDIAALAAIAHGAGARLCVDNTFASPYNQRPLEMGADLVVHSATKYLNGHSDVVCGVVATSDDGIAEDLRFMQKATGGVAGPWDSWLVMRGAKTLHLRMEAHNRNGQRVAGFLESHAAVEAVYYPGLPSHPQHELARQQMRGFSGMVSFEMGSLERARTVAEATRLFALAESLGGVESLIVHPAIMTHASVPREMRESMGVTDGLLRLSVGIEDADDLVEDLDQALSRVA
ncbi:MAG: PLP-dependent aspartate aminotransferase family protein [Gemmatimonadetes bacterium]|nr:PLP-dependent aspartate aminotransferase family protein [Gemmatimonadota bacterium]